MKQDHGFDQLDLDRFRNNIGVTAAERASMGQLNVWGNSLPASQMPPPGELTVDGVPFRTWPYSGTGPDNVRCAGQFVPLPESQWDWLYVLATAERRAEDEVAFHFADAAVDFEAIRISDFWAAPAQFGESAAIQTTAMHYPHHVQDGVPGTIWCQRVPITRRAVAVAVRLPVNVAVHLFAATLVRS